MLKKSDLAYKQEGEGTSHVYRCGSAGSGEAIQVAAEARQHRAGGDRW